MATRATATKTLPGHRRANVAESRASNVRELPLSVGPRPVRLDLWGNATFAVGNADAESLRLIEVTRECLELGIAAVGPGRPFSDIGRAMQPHAEASGFGVVRSFVGHGIGEQFHTDLHVPHYYEPRLTTPIEEGMTFTIEPMITMGAYEHDLWDDGWTAVTVDRRRTAQFEHTLVVTADGCDVLTRL